MIIAGYDVSYAKDSNLAIACLSVFDSEKRLIEELLESYEPDADYVPGELWRREVAGLDALLPKLRSRVDLIVIDGCGTIHPKRFGAACAYSERFARRFIGCAKNLLVGTHPHLAEPAGSRSPIDFEGHHVGYAFRSASKVKPIYVSTGCDLSQDQALAIIEGFCIGFRIPEVTRRPDMASREALRRWSL